MDPGERSRMTESHLPKRPVISVSLSPKFLDDWDKLQLALSVLTQRLISPATLWKRVSLQQKSSTNQHIELARIETGFTIVFPAQFKKCEPILICSKAAMFRLVQIDEAAFHHEHRHHRFW